MPVTATITLNPAARLAEGVERQIFAHPDDPTLLVKVLKTRPTASYTRLTFGQITQRFFPTTRWRPIAKQMAEYARLQLTYQHDPTFVSPVSHLYGFVQTNLGLACLTERITDAAGQNAPTLKDSLASHTFTADDLAALNAFVADLYRIGVRAGDLNAGNFVYGFRHTHPADTPQWVLVDGFGDFHAIPIRSASRWTNRLGLDDCFHRMKNDIPLTWDRRQRRFHL